MTDVTQLRLDVDDLTKPGGLVEKLWRLLPEPVADPTVGTTSHHKVTGSPAPWHVEAAGVYMDVHATARKVEDRLLTVVAGHKRGRGASVRNTMKALQAIPDLAAAAGDPHARRASDEIARLCGQAREVRDIDEADRWVPLPRRVKEKPVACPYCETYALRMNVRTGDVRCTNKACRDSDDRRPKARMDKSRLNGDGILAFRDGLVLDAGTGARARADRREA